MKDQYLICHDNAAILDHWLLKLSPKAKGFRYPTDLMDFLKKNISNLSGKSITFIFDRIIWKADMVKDPIISDFKEMTSGCNTTWILASNHHNFGDKLAGWDLVKDGTAMSEIELLEMLNHEA